MRHDWRRQQITWSGFAGLHGYGPDIASQVRPDSTLKLLWYPIDEGYEKVDSKMDLRAERSSIGRTPPTEGFAIQNPAHYAGGAHLAG